ncbi:MAG: hypothetical protein AAF515_00245 [Pseudomonadota bacterium]
MSRYLPGDVLSRRKGVVMHRGIALGDGRVLHNTPRRGEHISSEAEFAAGHRVRVQPQAYGARRRAIAHATALEYGAGRRYNLLGNNCEHTVHRASDGESRSPQLRGWLAGAGCAAVAFALTRHAGVAAAGFALGQKLLRR